MKLGGEVGAYQLTLKEGVTNAQHAPHPHSHPHPQTHTQRQPNIWINADIGVFSIGHLGTNFTEISIAIYAFSFKKNAFENVVWKTAAILSRPQGVNSSPTQAR